jgi:hypothetical protein
LKKLIHQKTLKTAISHTSISLLVMWRYKVFFLFGKLSKNDRDNHFWRAIDKTREIVKIIITKQNDLLILAHHRFAYIDLIAGDVETHIFFFGKLSKIDQNTTISGEPSTNPGK